MKRLTGAQAVLAGAAFLLFCLLGGFLAPGLSWGDIIGTAHAGEPNIIGKLEVRDGGSICNRTTGGGVSTQPSTAFNVDFPLKFTFQPEQDCYVCVDCTGCDAGTCLKFAANSLNLSQTNGNASRTGHAYNWDGGTQANPFPVTYNGGWVCASAVPPAVDCVVKFAKRSGLE